MKAPKEVRRFVNRQRAQSGKKNGVVKWLWEDIWMALKIETSKKRNKRSDRDT